MKRNFNFPSFLIVSAFFFFTFVFLFFTYTSFSQESSTQSNLEKLQLTFPVNFTEKEKKFINSLSQTDLEKLIRVIKLIIEKNKAAQSVPTQNLTAAPQTTYSNDPSPRTPYFNQSTGQYQSTPVSGGDSSLSGNPGVNNNVNSGQQNPYSNNLPFSAQNQSPLSPFSQSPSQPLTPAAALIKGLNQGLQDNSKSNVSCNPRNGSDAENRAVFSASGIAHQVSSGFHDLPIDTALMLKELEADCNCKILVTSASRKFNRTSPNSEHGPGKRVVDLAYQPAITNYLKSKAGNGCRFTIKGIKFIDEKVCPTSAATGPHWHLNGNNWQCQK